MHGTKNILAAVRPLTLLSNWIYFNSFSVKEDKIVFSRYKAMATIVFTVFCFIVKYLRMVWYSYPGFEQFVVNLTTCLIIIFWLASSLNCLAQGKSLARLWNEILTLECFITEDAFYRKAFRLTCFQLIGFNVLFISYISLYYYLYPEDFENFSTCLETLVDYCIIIHFCATEAFFYNCLHFGTKLISVTNEELLRLKRIEYYNDRKRWKGLDFIKLQKIKKLRSQMKMVRGEDLSPLMDIYERLCVSYEELNECFGVSLTASCLNNLTQMTLSCYFMTKHGWDGIRLFSVWLAYCFISEWNLLQACEHFVKETEKTRHIIDLVVTEGSSKVLKDGVSISLTTSSYFIIFLMILRSFQVRRFSQHLLHYPMKFTACRLFDLNYRLLFSVVTNIISYLVVVLQFESSRNTDTI